MKNQPSRFLLIAFFLFTGILFAGVSCTKNLPVKNIVYSNDFEQDSLNGIKIFDNNGRVDSLKVFSFLGNKVCGRFNNDQVYLKIKNLPDHNAVRLQFDLYIHDKWDGDHLIPGNPIPDAWQMLLDDYPFYLTTFSNGPYRQSFPANYTPGGFPNPPGADSWNTNLPGVCALQSGSNGSSLYKIDITTSHARDSVVLSCNDALQPYKSYCQKSWSIDNLVITSIKY
jgi:hypothetical protein